MIWFVETRLGRKPKDKRKNPRDLWYWTTWGEPCPNRSMTRYLERLAKLMHPDSHYRIRQYGPVENSHG